MNETTISELRRRLDDEKATLVSQLTEMGVDPTTGQPSEFAQEGFADSGQSTAGALSGTVRCLPPVPHTTTRPRSRSTSSTSRPVASAIRSPLP